MDLGRGGGEAMDLGREASEAMDLGRGWGEIGIVVPKSCMAHRCSHAHDNL